MTLPPFVRHGCFRALPLLALLTAASVSHAQPPGTTNAADRADPLDAQARVPLVVHVSPLASYRRLGEDRRIDWKEANETVNRIGGWRSYAREARLPVPAPAAAGDRSAAMPAAPKHGGHDKH